MTQLAAAPPLAGVTTTFQIRPYRPDDEALVRAMRLSRESLYERFFAGTPYLPSFYVRALNKADHWNHEVLIALDGEAVIGLAEYARAATDRAHLAVMVADEWQRRGVARRLVTALIALARVRGVVALHADVLASNASAVAAVRSLWPAAPAVRGDGGTVTYQLPIH